MTNITSLGQRIRSIWTPAAFQGWGKKRNYFEGWYYKLVSADLKHAIAIIPGVAYESGRAGKSQSFIQILDGISNRAEYHKFPEADFRPKFKKFEVEVGLNKFSSEKLELNLPDIQGDLTFTAAEEWPVSFTSPGIMGWYAFVPFMECYHGVTSMYSEIQGSLLIKNEQCDFTGGRAYLEKDWGRSFPSSWIWMQSNHFGDQRVSVKISVAKIPWLRNSFIGFIGGVWIDGKLYRFTTYTGAELKKVAVSGDLVKIVLADKKYKLEITAHRSEAAMLVSPINGIMEGRVNESMTSEMDVKLTEKHNGVTIFEGRGLRTGLEVAGKFSELLS